MSTSKALPTVLITGGNRGLGLTCAQAIAIAKRGPCRLVLASGEALAGLREEERMV